MKRFLPQILGITLGLMVGQTALYAQSIFQTKADPANNACWDQPAVDLPTAQAIHVQASFDGAAVADVTATCSGSTSPFRCTVPLPMVNQTVGVHQWATFGATVDPTDGTFTPYTLLASMSYQIVPAPQPPLAGSNPRIIKIIIAIATATIALIHFLF